MAGIEGIGGLTSVGTGLGTSGIGAWGPSSTTTGGVDLSGLLSADDATSTQGVGATSSGDGFAGLLMSSIENLNSAQNTADDLAVQAATGTLRDPADYTLAASKAELMTQLTVAVRDKAVNAFNEIMRMSL